MQTGAGWGKSLLETVANPSNVGSVSNTQNPPTETNGTHAPTNRPRTENGTVDGPPTWSIEKSAELYQIRGWGEPYFRVSANGCVEVSPDPDARAKHRPVRARAGPSRRAVSSCRSLIRFTDILQDRIRRLNECFGKAIKEYDYPGVYRGVFPVKVNQQRHLVEEVVEFGAPWSYGLEAGSKPELLIALAAMQRVGRAHHLQRLQGPEVHRDRAPRAALRQDRHRRARAHRGARLRRSAPREKLGIAPALGVRAKLTAQRRRALDGLGGRPRQVRPHRQRRSSRWSTGSPQRDMLDCLQLLHFHIGSQISSIIPIKNAMQEAANIYVELAKMGAQHEVPRRRRRPRGRLRRLEDRLPRLARTTTSQEYAADVVATIQEACTKAQRRRCPPSSARAGARSTAHQSVLVFEVVGANEVRFGEPRRARRRRPPRAARSSTRPAKASAEERAGGLPRRQQGEGRGAEPVQVRLPQPARARSGRAPLLELLREDPRPRAAPEVRARRARRTSSGSWRAIYYCNFSVFQSVPDTGPSISSSRSCRSTGSTKSPPCAPRSPTSPATATA